MLEEAVDYLQPLTIRRSLVRFGFSWRHASLNSSKRLPKLSPLGYYPPGKRRKGQSPIHRVEVALEKPAAMGGNALPSIKIVREPADYNYEDEDAVFGTVDIIYEIDALGIYELRVAPGKTIPPHFHRDMSEAELILDFGLECQNVNSSSRLRHFGPSNLYIPTRIPPMLRLRFFVLISLSSSGKMRWRASCLWEIALLHDPLASLARRAPRESLFDIRCNVWNRSCNR